MKFTLFTIIAMATMTIATPLANAEENALRALDAEIARRNAALLNPETSAATPLEVRQVNCVTFSCRIGDGICTRNGCLACDQPMGTVGTCIG